MRATHLALLYLAAAGCSEPDTASPADPSSASAGGAAASSGSGGQGGVAEPAPIDASRVRTFDGATTYTPFGPTHHLELTAGESLSVSVWIRPNSIDGYDTIFGRPTPCGSVGNYVVDFVGQQPRFCYRDATLTVDHCAMIGEEDVPLGEWTHVAMTYTYGDGSSFRGYIDGKPTNSGSWYAGDGSAPPWSDPTVATEAGRFAGCATGGEYFYDGDLYELAVYDRVLSEDEIHQHWLRKVALPCAEKLDRTEPVQLTLLDEDATGYATFQSHNQKVVQNQHGIFVSYIRTRNEAFTAQQWRLLRSVDGGASFQIVYDETTGTNPPVLETDPHGNVYVVKQHYEAGSDATLMIFRPEDDFAVPQISSIPYGSSGKYALLFDWRRSQLYYFSHEGRFYRIALDGSVTFDQLLITPGPNAGPQYPYLAMDEDGVVYAAWTSQQHGVYMYWNIGAARSRDAGTSWERFDGTPLPTPIVLDDTGPAEAIQLPDELPFHTWLWNLAPKNKKVHFAYLAQTPAARQTYVRFDAVTGVEEARVAPVFGGGSTALFSLDGFPASDPGMPNRLFWTSASQSGSPRMAILQTTDNGASWLDYAQGGDPTLAPYAVGGARFVSEDGDILGTFADVVDGKPVRVWFLRASTRTESDPVGCL